MKYYSEITKKFYESSKECEADEAKVTQEQNQKNFARKAAAEKVETAYKAYTKAAKEYHEALQEFCSKFGTYHKTYTTNEFNDKFNDWLAFINML